MKCENQKNITLFSSLVLATQRCRGLQLLVGTCAPVTLRVLFCPKFFKAFHEVWCLKIGERLKDQSHWWHQDLWDLEPKNSQHEFNWVLISLNISVGHLIFKIQEIIHHFPPLSPCTGSRGVLEPIPAYPSRHSVRKPEYQEGTNADKDSTLPSARKAPVELIVLYRSLWGLDSTGWFWLRGICPGQRPGKSPMGARTLVVVANDRVMEWIAEEADGLEKTDGIWEGCQALGRVWSMRPIDVWLQTMRESSPCGESRMMSAIN